MGGPTTKSQHARVLCHMSELKRPLPALALATRPDGKNRARTPETYLWKPHVPTSQGKGAPDSACTQVIGGQPRGRTNIRSHF